MSFIIHSSFFVMKSIIFFHSRATSTDVAVIMKQKWVWARYWKLKCGVKESGSITSDTSSSVSRIPFYCEPPGKDNTGPAEPGTEWGTGISIRPQTLHIWPGKTAVGPVLVLVRCVSAAVGPAADEQIQPQDSGRSLRIATTYTCPQDLGMQKQFW